MKYEGNTYINKSFFSENEKTLLSVGKLSASTFIYKSGIHGIKLQNGLGYITVLPFMGQMVWDIVFGDRNLKMKSTYDYPIDADFFLYTYGAFVIHCGALRMGCPGPEDTHPLHGELPCARYRDVQVMFGENEKGRYIGVTGIFEYNITFGAHYIAIPEVLLYEGSTVLEISMKISNQSNYAMELMYMAHVNFCPVYNSRIVQSLGWTKDDIKIRESIPSHVVVPEGYREYLQKLKEHPELKRTINPEDVSSAELVFAIEEPKKDENGWSYFMQVHPDATADYVSYKFEEFDHGTRWFFIDKDRQALGLILPATADAEGYTAEKKKGNVKEIGPKGIKEFKLYAGYLDKKEALKMEGKINQIMSK